jgi:hypothetical protein
MRGGFEQLPETSREAPDYSVEPLDIFEEWFTTRIIEDERGRLSSTAAREDFTHSCARIASPRHGPLDGPDSDTHRQAVWHQKVKNSSVVYAGWHLRGTPCQRRFGTDPLSAFSAFSICPTVSITAASRSGGDRRYSAFSFTLAGRAMMPARRLSFSR